MVTTYQFSLSEVVIQRCNPPDSPHLTQETYGTHPKTPTPTNATCACCPYLAAFGIVTVMNVEVSNGLERRLNDLGNRMSYAGFGVQFPDACGLSQDKEYFLLTTAGVTRSIRFHDYGSIFAVPGLYEHLFEKLLHCDSPRVVVSLLTQVIHGAGQSISKQRVLDLGAGNGAVGGELRSAGFCNILALDRDENARRAAWRDQPDAYDGYFLADAGRLPDSVCGSLRAAAPTCLTCVAALGFRDAPLEAFVNVIDLLVPGGWCAVSLHEDLVDLTADLLALRRVTIHRRERYRHRLAIDGRPIHYICLIGSTCGKRAE